MYRGGHNISFYICKPLEKAQRNKRTHNHQVPRHARVASWGWGMQLSHVKPDTIEDLRWVCSATAKNMLEQEGLQLAEASFRESHASLEISLT